MNYYNILGVDKKATPEEIKSAYRKLAIKHHPDLNHNNPKSEKDFKEINAAYVVLIDPIKRSEYDLKGFVGRRPPSPPTQKKAEPKPQPKPEKKKEEPHNWLWDGNVIFHPTDNQLEKIQCSYFGNMSTGKNILTHIFCTPDELKNGVKKDILFKRREMCKLCVGDGEQIIACPKCRGSKHIAWCEACENQRLKTIKCTLCKGNGIDGWIIVRMPITIPPNSMPGGTITLHGEGEGAPRKAPGNVRVIFIEKEETQ